jgi:group I intron endonuclease
MGITFIYALNDPETGECRYIGKADKPEERYQRHLSQAKSGKTNFYKDNWIRRLQLNGLNPVLEILRSCPVEGWEVWERAYIQTYREFGANLTNISSGGDGGPAHKGENHHNFGKRYSAELKRKLSEAHRGQKPWNTGKVRSAETNEKISRTLKGRCAGDKNPYFGKTHSAEIRLRMRAGQIFGHAMARFMRYLKTSGVVSNA